MRKIVLLLYILIGQQIYGNNVAINDSVKLYNIFESYYLNYNVNYTDSCIYSLYDDYEQNKDKRLTKSYIDFLILSTDYFIRTNNFKEAETFNDLYLSYLEQNKKEISIDYCTTLYQRSQISYSMSRWEDAICFCEMSLRTLQQIDSIPDILMKQIQQSLYLYKLTLEKEDIEYPLYKNSDLTIDGCIFKLAIQPDSIVHQRMLSELTRLENSSSNFNEFQYIRIFKSLANFYLANNLLIQMDELLNRLYVFYKKNDIKSAYANIIYYFHGRLNACRGLLDDAINTLNMSKDSYEKSNILDTDYITLLGTLAQCYYFKGDYTKSKEIIDNSWNILTNELKYSITPTILDDILSIKALVYSSDNSDSQNTAYNIYLELYQKYKNNPSKFQIYNASLHGLLFLSLIRHDYINAVKYKIEIKNDKRIPQSQRFSFMEDIEKYLWQHNDSSLINDILERDAFLKRTAIESLGYYSEIERTEMFNNTSSQLSLDMYLLEKYNENPDVCSLCYDNVLFYKNIFLSSDKMIRDETRKSKNKELSILMDEIDSIKRKIIYEGIHNEEEINNWADSLMTKQRLMTSKIPIEDIIRNHINTWEDVRDALAPNEVAIEIVKILPIEEWHNTAGEYAALIVNKESIAPECVLLDNVPEFSNELASALSFDPVLVNELYLRTNNLYHKFWKKIEPKLFGKTRIYLSLCDALNQVNFNFIKNEHGQVLSDKYELFILTSTNELCNKKNYKEDYKSAVVYGGVAFDSSENKLKKEAAKYEKLHDIKHLDVRDVVERGKLCQLNAAGEEADSIYSIMKNSGINVKIKKGIEANEESFKSLNGCSPSIIHFATHGFNLTYSFSPDLIKKNGFSSNLTGYNKYTSAMLSTGLMMAGANRVWKGETQIANVEDGILTSEEISYMDLSSTDIVSLAACKTGTGNYNSLYGIVGLPLSLKLAGVKSVIVSLWNVDDLATSLMMKSFYEELLKTKNKYQSFRHAQQIVRDRYPDPYYWAGFVIID